MEVPFARYSAVSDRCRVGSFGSTRANALLYRLRGPLRPSRFEGAVTLANCHARWGARSRGLYRLAPNEGPGRQERPNERPRLLPQTGELGFVPDESRRKFWTRSVRRGVGNEMPAPGSQAGRFRFGLVFRMAKAHDHPMYKATSPPCP
jgi:hypothetical protein